MIIDGLKHVLSMSFLGLPSAFQLVIGIRINRRPLVQMESPEETGHREREDSRREAIQCRVCQRELESVPRTQIRTLKITTFLFAILDVNR